MWEVASASDDLEVLHMRGGGTGDVGFPASECLYDTPRLTLVQVGRPTEREVSARALQTRVAFIKEAHGVGIYPW